ncbi:MAG: ribonuclease P protein component [Candidatus Andersenbacteria bacterium]
MLAASNRLRSDSDIKQTLRQGRRLTTPGVRIFYRQKTNQTQTRIACVVGVVVDRRAVARHRYQRWLRVAAAQVIERLPQGSVFDMVWIAQRGITTFQSQQDLTDMVTAALLEQIKK